MIDKYILKMNILIMALTLVVLVMLAYQSNRGTQKIGIDTLTLVIIIIALLMIGPYLLLIENI